jgi:glycosyltransferase involved in cell wall biosynthesis
LQAFTVPLTFLRDGRDLYGVQETVFVINGKRVAVVLPAYNADRTLERTYNEIDFNIVDDVILVDDCSKDRTSALARELGIYTACHPDNRGYGGNQKTCYTIALERGADIVIMLHPDYQYSPKLVPAMAGMIASGHYDAVFASRILGNGALAGGMPLYKYVANRCLTALQNLLMGAKLSEYHTGYRAWSREVLETLALPACSDDFVFDNQMIAQTMWTNFQIGEISCPTRYFEEASSINFRRSCTYGFGVLGTAFLYRLCKMGLTSSELFTSNERLPHSADGGRGVAAPTPMVAENA